MTDKLGKEIKIGCFVAYGHAMGRSAGLRIGRVEAVNIKTKNGKDASTITVLGLNDDWKRNKPRLLTKRSTLLFPTTRTVVVDGVPKEIIDLYAKDCVALGGKHTWVTEKGFTFYHFCDKCGCKDHI